MFKRLLSITAAVVIVLSAVLSGCTSKYGNTANGAVPTTKKL